MNQRVQIIDGKLQSGDPDCLLEWVVRRPNGEPAEIGYYAGSAYVSGNKLNVARGVHLEEFTVDSKPTPESAQRDAGYHHGMKQKRHIWPGKRADESADYADGWGLAWSERRRVEDNKKRWADEDKQTEAGKSRSNPGSRRKVAKSVMRPAKKSARKNPASKRKAATRYVTKPGHTGTLYLWDVKVFPADPGEAPYLVKMWSADADLLFDRLTYDDMLAGDGWEIVGRVKQSLTDQGPMRNPARKKPVSAKRNHAGRRNNPSQGEANRYHQGHSYHMTWSPDAHGTLFVVNVPGSSPTQDRTILRTYDPEKAQALFAANVESGKQNPSARRKTGRKNPTWAETHAADNAVYRKAVESAAASGKPWGRVIESKAFRDAMAASTRIFASWRYHQRVEAFATDLQNAKYGAF